MISAIRPAPTPLVSLPSPDLAGDPALFAAALAGLEGATAIGGEPRQAPAAPGNPLPVDEIDNPGLTLLRAYDTAAVRLPSPRQRSDAVGRTDLPPPVPRPPVRAPLIRPSSSVEPEVAADAPSSEREPATSLDGDQVTSGPDEAPPQPDVSVIPTLSTAVPAPQVVAETERAAPVAAQPDAEPGRADAPSFGPQTMEMGASRTTPPHLADAPVATRSVEPASGLAVRPSGSTSTPPASAPAFTPPIPVSSGEPTRPSAAAAAAAVLEGRPAPPMPTTAADAIRSPAVMVPDGRPAQPAPVTPDAGDGPSAIVPTAAAHLASRSTSAWATVAPAGQTDQLTPAPSGPHPPETRRAMPAPPEPRPADAPPPATTAVISERPSPEAIPAGPAPIAASQGARPFRRDLEPASVGPAGRDQAPTPDKAVAADPRRTDVAAAPIPTTLTRPIAAATTGPAFQLFAAELRRDARAPAPLEAFVPAAAIHPTASATDFAAPLDLRQEQWPGVMVERIERLRDAADAADTRIRLVPDQLGALDVSVKREGETVHVHFTAEQAATRALLQEAAPRLAEAAEARGLRLGQTSVDGGGAGRGDGRQPPPHAAHAVPAPARAAERATDDTDDRIA